MDQKRLDLIDEYLLGRLSGTELDSFVSKMEADIGLQKAVNQRRTLIGYVVSAENQNLSADVRQVHKDILREKRSRRKKTAIGLWLAVVFLIFGLAWIAYSMLSTGSDYNELYAQYYTAKEISFGIRNVDTIYDAKLAEAGNYYEGAHYSKALALFQEILNDRADAKIQLAAALCYLELNQPKEALIALQRIIDAQDPVYMDDARWYAVLSNLLLNKREDAKNLLDSLVQESSSYYKKRASQLIRQL